MAGKRKIAGAVLTFVTLLMFLTALMPHHHHEDEVCFAETHCESEAEHQIPADCSDAAGHEHDLPGEQTDCNVLHVYLLPDLKLSSESREISKIFRGHLLCILMTSEDHHVFNTCAGSNGSPQLPGICRDRYKGAPSLRAPPAIS